LGTEKKLLRLLEVETTRKEFRNLDKIEGGRGMKIAKPIKFKLHEGGDAMDEINHKLLAKKEVIKRVTGNSGSGKNHDPKNGDSKWERSA
jgi:hypothetical protein